MKDHFVFMHCAILRQYNAMI